VRKTSLILTFIAISASVFSQSKIDSIQQKADAVVNKVNINTVTQKALQWPDTIKRRVANRIGLVKDSLQSINGLKNEKYNVLVNKLQHKADSLQALGKPSSHLQKQIDSVRNLANLPSEKIAKLASLQQQLKDSLIANIPSLDSVKAISNKAKAAMNEVNQVSTGLGIGPLGQDLKVGAQMGFPLLQGPAVKTDLSTLNTAMPSAPNPDLKVPQANTQLPDLNQKIPDVKGSVNGLVPDEAKGVQNEMGKITKSINEGSAVVKQGEEYVKDVKTIQEEGLNRSEKIPELAEKQLLKVDEIKEFQQETAIATATMDEYKALIEKYKEEKAIKEDLEKKSKDMATDLIMSDDHVQNSMKKIGKLKKKFPNVADMRELPKRAPNPMKELHWRDRLVPSLGFYTFSTNRTWLQIDPEIYYKVSKNISLGIGTIYRFSLNAGKITFSDFGNSHGYKAFVQYHAYKGFWLRAEGQQVTWKPWNMKIQDPSYQDKVNVLALGILKSYNISKRIKGNTQLLYHHSWNGFDPYKQKVIIRVGIDFSIRKATKQPWRQQLKEAKRKQQSSH
jgi:hypothetical protein